MYSVCRTNTNTNTCLPYRCCHSSTDTNAITYSPPPPTATPVARRLTILVAEPDDAQPAIAAELQQAAQIATLDITIVPRNPDGLLLSLATDQMLGLPPPDLIWANQEALVGLLADNALAPLNVDLPLDVLPGLQAIAQTDTTLWGRQSRPKTCSYYFTSPTVYHRQQQPNS